MPDTDFKSQLKEKAELVNRTLKQILQGQKTINDRLKESMQYTLTAPGKRIRAALTLWSCELVAGAVNSDALIAAAAIEMVHTYSLVHDDLPAMDDDDLRRGVPTCHKAFDEATAILTGDALLTLAFEILSKRIEKADIAARLVAQLASDAGPSGMIAGQMADLQAENKQADTPMLEYIHTNKTAKMFRCAAAMGAICGAAEDEDLERLCRYAMKIGLGFQIADDILDVSASSEQLGKTAGKDQKAAKCTYPALVGIQTARKIETRLAEEAIEEIEPFGPDADVLRQLAMALLERTK